MITTDNKSVIDKRKFMEQALIIDTLRGDDSTGVFYQGMKNIGTAGWAKAVGDGYTFTQSDDYQKLAVDMDKYWFMVGHNRAATVGAVNVEGAHPFQEGPITMVHNGTLRSTYHLPKTQEELGVEVDSHALCHNLAIMDPEDAHEVFTIIDGAFTLVWHDARDGSLNIIRNSERPLHFAQSRLDDVLYFTSEAGQLQWLDSRLKLDLHEICFPEPGLHLKFMRDSLEPKAVKHTLTPKYHYGTGYTQGSGGYDRAYQQWWEEEDDYEVYSSNGVPMGKQEPRQDNRVHVGGRKREIPQQLQEMLLNEDLLIEDRLLFTPMAKHVRSGNHAFVVGQLDSIGTTAVIYRVEKHVADTGFDRRWLVRPVAVKYADREQATPIIVCKMESSAGTPAQERIAAATTRMDTRSTDLPDVYPCAGTWVGKQEWLELTAEGCTYCEAVLHLEQAENIVWVQDEMPLCPTCGEDAYLVDEFGRDLPWID